MAESNPAQSYAGLMFRLGQCADQLRLHGEALDRLGMAVPECLAKPYEEYRQKTREAAEKIFDMFRLQHTEEEYNVFHANGIGFLRIFDDLPKGIAQNPELGEKWSSGSFAGGVIIPTGGGSGVGGLGLSPEDYIFSGSSKTPTGALTETLVATEKVAANTFFRGLLTTGGGIWGFAKKRILPVFLVVDTLHYMFTEDLVRKVPLEDLIRPMVQQLARETEKTIDDFETDYLSKTVQQWQGVIRISRAAKGNQLKMVELMKGYDPHVEKPLPPAPEDWDAFGLADLAGMPTRDKPKYNWLAFPLLVGGSTLSMYVFGED